MQRSPHSLDQNVAANASLVPKWLAYAAQLSEIATEPTPLLYQNFAAEFRSPHHPNSMLAQGNSWDGGSRCFEHGENGMPWHV